jgi:hypothetical protein
MPKYFEKLFTTNTSSRRLRAVLASTVVEPLVDLVHDQDAAAGRHGFVQGDDFVLAEQGARRVGR